MINDPRHPAQHPPPSDSGASPGASGGDGAAHDAHGGDVIDDLLDITSPEDAAPHTPRLPGVVVIRKEVDEVIDAASADMMIHARNCVRVFGDFHLALSGGSTPQPLYRRLMYDPLLRDFPWARTHLWIVDERRVPFDDPASNFGMIRDLLVSQSDIPPEQVHPIHATRDDADVAYEQELQATLAWREKGHDRLDFVLLGVGDDGHTASLFPRSPALEDGGRLVLRNDGPTVTPPPRITMTLRLLNASRFVGILVLGDRKRDIVARIARAEDEPEDLPIRGVRPLGGDLRWYLDWAACPTR